MSDERPNRDQARLDDPVVIEPRPSRLDPPIRGPVIICPAAPLLMVAARALGAKKRLRSLGPASCYTIKLGKQEATLLGPGMGAPAAVYALERAIANGARHFIMLGLAGSLTSTASIGGLVVPNGAWSEEGTSSHYARGDGRTWPSDRAVEALRRACSDHGKSCHLGPVWTTDAVFRETRAKVREFGAKGLLAVEMEASALFTVARCRGVELGALLVVSDELAGPSWKSGFTRPRFLAAMRHGAIIARAAAFLLVGNENILYTWRPK